MKSNIKVTFSAIMAALATVFMLLSYFPYLTYAIPAISGLCIMAVVIEINKKWAFGAFLVSATLVFLLAETESKLLFIGFFGYYPILKAIIDNFRKPTLEWVLKIIIFNVAVLAVYLGFAKLFGISLEDFGSLGKYGAYILLILGNIVFVMYDMAVSRMATVYMNVIHSKISKYIK